MTLIFVYNANSGKFNALLDSAHKMISPQTYACDLCALTHDALREKEEWLRFRESVNAALKFLHKDEFLKAYRSKWLPKYDFPIVLEETPAGLEIVISADKFKEITTLQDLIHIVKKAIES